MRIIVRFLIVAGLLLVLGTISAACGGDDELADELTLEEFFQQSEAIDDDFEERLEGVYDGIPDRGEETDEDLQALKAFYAEFSAVYDEFFDQLETLNPPSEAEDALDELLTVGREIVAFVEEFADRAEGAQSFPELDQLLDETEAESDPIQEAYQAACRSLQDVADGNGIVAKIQCADDF